jgi:uncharacterized membrane protein SirB2
MAAAVEECTGMIEFYPQIKSVHVWLILLSGSLFALRGLLVLLGQRWAMHAALRYLSYSIDSALLTAAMMLLVILKLNPFLTPWLACKLVLLVLYVVLGSFALKRAATVRGRGLAYFAAVLCFVTMYGIARAHHPLGWLVLA